MDTFDFVEPPDCYIHRKEIYIDDIPVDSFLFRNAKYTEPTPADIILLWIRGYELDDTMEKILVSILVNDIMIASDVGMIYEAESVLNKALGSTGNDPETAIRLLIALINLHYHGNEKKGRDYYYKAKLLESESSIKLDRITENKWKIIRTRMEHI